MLTEVVFGYSLLHLQPFFLIFCLLLDDIIHCIVLIFVYICSEFISEQHGTWHLASAKQTPPSSHLPRTKAVPSSLHACISLAPSMHDNREVYAVSMRVSRIINLRNPELLFLPWSEQGANKERTRSEGMPPKPAKINITYLITHKLSQLILENSVFEQTGYEKFWWKSNQK